MLFSKTLHKMLLLLTYKRYILLFLNYSVVFYFWLYHVACGIIVPQPGMEPVPPTLEAWSLNHWSTVDQISPQFFSCNL